MLENNLIFSLITSSIISVIMNCINYKRNTLNEDKKNDIIILFGITFATIFVLKILSQSNISTTSGGSINNYKPPF